MRGMTNKNELPLAATKINDHEMINFVKSQVTDKILLENYQGV
jgi:hypothetical protein